PKVQEYSYHLKGIKPGGKKTEDEEITDNVVLYEHIITAKFTEERKFSIHFGIFSDKSSLEERLQGILEWESNPLYDDYEDFTRYYLRNRTQHLFVPCEIAFKGPFEDELIQQVLDYIYASILSQIDD
ncbi:MAG: hypothetical protein K2J85_02995, partial [Anaeroplasmataceae bacterium]|nr:hypothetical protein [Anaeroplasmataceae bacterium]